MDLYSRFPPSWKALWPDQNQLKTIFNDIESQVEACDKKYQGLSRYPSDEQVLDCFQYFPPKSTRVIIIGQDCYHGPDQATGLCFAVPEGHKIPPSLRNIIKECRHQYGDNITIPSNLIDWANQGVLLLNCALTVRQACPGSHLNIWKPFIESLLQQLSTQVDSIIFLLWGGFAKNKKKTISSIEKHYVLEANHPSPLSANRGGWFQNDHFLQVNTILKKSGRPTITWYESQA